MKIKTLLSACFAGTGIYLILTGSMTVIFSFYLISIGHDDPYRLFMICQYLGLCIPFILGVLFLTLAPRFSGIVCRFAKIGEDEFTTIIHPDVAITVACVVTGLTLAISQIPEFAQLLVKQFFVAANPTYAAEHRGEDYRLLMIRPATYSVLSLI